MNDITNPASQSKPPKYHKFNVYMIDIRGNYQLHGRYADKDEAIRTGKALAEKLRQDAVITEEKAVKNIELSLKATIKAA